MAKPIRYSYSRALLKNGKTTELRPKHRGTHYGDDIHLWFMQNAYLWGKNPDILLKWYFP